MENSSANIPSDSEDEDAGHDENRQDDLPDDG